MDKKDGIIESLRTEIESLRVKNVKQGEVIEKQDKVVEDLRWKLRKEKEGWRTSADSVTCSMRSRLLVLI